MKKQVLFVLGSILLISVTSFSMPGSGTETDPYLIEDFADFEIFADSANAATYWASEVHTKLTADIDLDLALTDRQTYTTAVIAPDTSTNSGFQGTLFSGIFDGNGHVISNLTIDIPVASNDYLGLFGNIASGAEVNNFGVVDASITGGNSVHEFLGILCGFNSGSITNCYATGSVAGGDISQRLGGLCGENYNGSVSNCYVNGSVSGSYEVGGLVGFNGGTVIKSYSVGIVNGYESVGGLVRHTRYSDDYHGITMNCYSTMTVSSDYYAGGLVGDNDGSTMNCYATGTVSGNTDIGGLVGLNRDTITNCYSTGSVSGTDYVGGLLGRNSSFLSISNCFWDKETSGMTVGYNLDPDRPGTITNVLGKTTAQMQTQSTFTNAPANWDFETPIWMISGQDYPRLIWYYSDISNDGRVNLADFSKMAQRWLDAECGFCSSADLTGDRNVNNYDLLILANHWLDEDTISDHVFSLDIGMAYDYEFPTDTLDPSYEFDFELRTDITVERVEFLTPAGNTFEITIAPETYTVVPDGWVETGYEYDPESGEYEWYYGTSFNNLSSLDAYGDGNYTITVYHENGRSHQTTVWFGVPGTTDPIAQPTQEPVFISFDHGAILSSPVTFTWNTCIDSAAELVWFGVNNQDTDEEVFETMLDVTATGLPAPLDMESGSYEAELGFEVWHNSQNSDGINIWAGKYSECDYYFTVQ